MRFQDCSYLRLPLLSRFLRLVDVFDLLSLCFPSLVHTLEAVRMRRAVVVAHGFKHAMFLLVRVFLPSLTVRFGLSSFFFDVKLALLVLFPHYLSRVLSSSSSYPSCGLSLFCCFYNCFPAFTSARSPKPHFSCFLFRVCVSFAVCAPPCHVALRRHGCALLPAVCIAASAVCFLFC